MTGLRAMAENDVPEVLEIIRQAQAFLAAQGIDQWQNGYPNAESTRNDIEKKQGYIYDVDGRPAGILSIVLGDEPSYQTIYGGEWRTAEPYACIHRMAIGDRYRGGETADAMMRAAEALVIEKGIDYIRVDTHRENVRMRRMLRRNGYVRCGVIYLSGRLEANDERVAFDKLLNESG